MQKAMQLLQQHGRSYTRRSAGRYESGAALNASTPDRLKQN